MQGDCCYIPMARIVTPFHICYPCSTGFRLSLLICADQLYGVDFIPAGYDVSG